MDKNQNDKNDKNQSDKNQNIDDPKTPFHDESSPYESTRKVVHRHISDINDEITDEDIKNAYTGKPHPPEAPDPELIKTEQEDLEQSKKDDLEEDQDDDDIDRHPVPPTNILS